MSDNDTYQQHRRTLRQQAGLPSPEAIGAYADLPVPPAGYVYRVDPLDVFALGAEGSPSREANLERAGAPWVPKLFKVDSDVMTYPQSRITRRLHFDSETGTYREIRP